MPIFTPHALERIAERFSTLNMEEEFARARRIGKRVKSKIAASCPNAARIYMRGGFKGRYYMMTRDEIIFVVEPPETVVTVFKLIR